MLHCQNEAGLREQPLRKQSFTLIEMLAVMVVIAMLAGIMLGVVGYVQKSTLTQVTRTQIALLATALESYKTDWGFYPATTPVRLSSSLIAESTNNAILYRALMGQAKKYLKGFPAGQLRTNTATSFLNIFDVFGTPFNYYNSPSTAYSMMNNVLGVNTNTGCTVGGQINPVLYDLFSYGPNHVTFADPHAWAVNTFQFPWGGGWSAKSSALDDITNWRP